MSPTPLGSAPWQDIATAIGVFGAPATVTMKGEGTRTILLAIGNVSPDELTQGMTQATKIAVVMSAAWSAAGFPRGPERGDEVEAGGVKFSIVDVQPQIINGVLRMYRLGLRG